MRLGMTIVLRASDAPKLLPFYFPLWKGSRPPESSGDHVGGDYKGTAKKMLHCPIGVCMYQVSDMNAVRISL